MSTRSDHALQSPAVARWLQAWRMNCGLLFAAILGDRAPWRAEGAIDEKEFGHRTVSDCWLSAGCLCLVILFGGAGLGGARGAEEDEGRSLFLTHCAPCHGP